MWNNCSEYEETFIIVKTNHNTIIGAYCPIKIEDTNDLETHEGSVGYKSFIGLKPFEFYFQDNKKLEILKLRDDLDYFPSQQYG